MAVPGGYGNDVRPIRHIALAVAPLTDRDDSAIGTQTNGVAVPGGYGNDVRPIRHIAPAAIVISDGDDGAIGTQTNGVAVLGGYGNDVRPIRHIALAVLVISDGSDGTVSTQTNGVVAPGGYGNDVRPAGHIALAVKVVSDGDDGTVRTQTNGVVFPGSYGNDVRPVGHIALAVIIIAIAVANGNDGTIRTKPNGVLISGGNHLPGGNTVPQAAALLRRVGIIPRLSKFDGGHFIVFRFQQGNRVLVTFLMIYSGNDHRYKQNHKRNADTRGRYSNRQCFFALFCCCLGSDTVFFGFAFRFQSVGFFLRLDFFYLLLTSVDLLVGILPAGNGLENTDCFLVRKGVFAGHPLFGRSI